MLWLCMVGEDTPIIQRLSSCHVLSFVLCAVFSITLRGHYRCHVVAVHGRWRYLTYSKVGFWLHTSS